MTMMMDTMETEMPLRILTVRETAKLLQINEAAVRKLLRAGELRASKVGRLWRIRMAAVEGFLHAKEELTSSA
jgi:excisionase family DNA binding protein